MDENGNRQQGEGSSRDISELGAFIFADACPPVGSSVRLRIALEGLPDAKGIDVKGSVIRVEQAADAKGSHGFAVLRSFFWALAALTTQKFEFGQSPIAVEGLAATVIITVIYRRLTVIHRAELYASWTHSFTA
jgi:PilZ domain